MNEVVYKGFRKDEMEFHFQPRVAAPDFPRWTEQRAKASAVVRENFKSRLNVPYGKSPRQVVDIFPADEPNAPVQVYIHGGYWRGGSKDDSSFVAGTFVKAGATVVLLEYDLCPTVTVTEIVRQARAGIAWVYRNIAGYGGDPSRLYISGTSVGGHLVAMALAYDWEKAERLPRDIIKGAVTITGVYDLDPVFHIGVNEEIRLNQETARENSPMLHPPLPHTPLIIVVGGDEPLGWKQMSMNFSALCKERGVDCQYLEIPGVHHYSLPALLADPKSLLSRAILAQMGQ
ncbi:MAG: alpha/beta hydrolase [Candidatus Binatia bacterium]